MINRLFNFVQGRYERKFVEENLPTNFLKDTILSIPAGFSKHFFKRKVNNIYFDTHFLSNFTNHLGGISERLKIRIRWYGQTYGEIKFPLLEFKLKKGLLGKKIHFPLKSFRFNGLLSMPEFKKNILLKSGLPDWVLESFQGLNPVLLNSYDREYFISRDKLFRFTLDTSLRFLKINSRKREGFEALGPYELKVIELKYGAEEDLLAGEITNSLPFRLTSFSKYLHGMKLVQSR